MIEAIRLLSAIPFERGPASLLDAAARSALNDDLAALGYAADAGLLSALGSLSPERFAEIRAELLGALREIAGADAPSTPLFAHFPNNVPNEASRIGARSRSFIRTLFRAGGARAETPPCGHVVVREEFAMIGLQGCPLCGALHPGLELTCETPAPLSKVTPLKPLAYIDASGLADFANALLARSSSLSLDERRLVRTANPALLRAPDAPFRETIPLLVELFPADQALTHVRTATDVLRVAAGLSAPDADLSLATPPRFRLSTSKRRMLLRMLDRIEEPLEDMLRHREPWLRLGEHLRPNYPRNYRAAPRAAKAFETLRNAPKSVPTFNRLAEAAIRTRRIDTATVNMLAARPGEFLRRVDLMLRLANDRAPILDALPEVLARATTKLLFELDAHLRYRDRAEYRVFRPKGMSNKIYFVPNRRDPIHVEDLAAARAAIASEIGRRLRRLPPMGRVHLLPELAKVPAPYNRRGDAVSSITLPKGGRVPFEGDVIRLFVHWIGEIDVDLSITLWDAVSAMLPSPI